MTQKQNYKGLITNHRRNVKQSLLKRRGSMKIVGHGHQALAELRHEREASLEKLVAGLK